MSAFLFIFSRFKKFQTKRGFLSFNYYLSIFLISFALFSTIISDSLTSGYKNEINKKISSLNFSFEITKHNDSNFSIDEYIAISHKLNDSLLFFSPLIERTGIIFVKNILNGSSNENYNQREGFYLRGLDSTYLRNSPIAEYFVNEKYTFKDSDIIISKHLSNKIKKEINDTINLLFLDEKSKNFQSKKYIIKNLFLTNTVFDDFLIFAPIESLSFNNNGVYFSKIIGDKNQKQLEKYNLDYRLYKINYWDSNYMLIFLNTFDAPIKLLMFFIMFLSVYSLSSLISNFTFEKKHDLKLLNLLGVSYSNIKLLIVALSSYITLISIFLGSLISILFIYIQNKFKLIKLPSERVFQMDFIPADFNILYLVKYPLFLMIATIIISLYFNRKYLKQYD